MFLYICGCMKRMRKGSISMDLFQKGWRNSVPFMALFLSFTALIIVVSGCSKRENIVSLEQLAEKSIGVPNGSIGDQLVLSRLPKANIKYFNSALDAALAVKAGRIDAAAYDEPIMRNIAAKNPGLKVLPEMITVDEYGFAMRLEDTNMKATADKVIAELKSSGRYDEMMARWFPKVGEPKPMPRISLNGTRGTLRFGTASVTEPFSFVDSRQQVVGFDIELAHYIARELSMQLEILDMEFGGMIPALISEKVDIIGACITITEERAKKVLFSQPYYRGGIAAIVKE
jgi:polar amino acid transport system substrate-binding protein